MDRFTLAVVLASTLSGCTGGGGPGEGPLPDCEWCGAMDAPGSLSAVMKVADEDEPGERIVLRGRVVEPDGLTPAPGVLVYSYHTDATGIYRKDGDETGNGRRHGALRGWLRTDDEGQYEIRTIQPAPYPSRSEPAHVHITLTPPSGDEDWVDSTLFEGDPLISPEERRRSDEAGAFGQIVTLNPGPGGVLIGRRDLRLEEAR